ncbi:MAG: hypothetical protein LBQ36_09625 [Synergistaceae bacterium]|nr:hypothetical protein [Synergistaceae bacterium]
MALHVARDIAGNSVPAIESLTPGDGLPPILRRALFVAALLALFFAGMSRARKNI